MRRIDHAFRSLHLKLGQRCLDQAFVPVFPADGRLVAALSRGRRYWFYDTPDGAGGKRRRYVGPVTDPEVTRRMEAFRELKVDVRARRKIVSTLVREAGLPRPDPIVGDIAQAMADAGLFRLQSVLVGTMAFGAYRRRRRRRPHRKGREVGGDLRVPGRRYGVEAQALGWISCTGA